MYQDRIAFVLFVKPVIQLSLSPMSNQHYNVKLVHARLRNINTTWLLHDICDSWEEFGSIRKYNWINKLRRIHPANMSAKFRYLLSCDSEEKKRVKILRTTDEYSYDNTLFIPMCQISNAKKYILQTMLKQYNK